MLLTDATLSREPIDIIEQQQINAEWALKIQTERLAQQFDEIDDEYLRQRKQDMLQVVERIQKNLIGQSTELCWTTSSSSPTTSPPPTPSTSKTNASKAS